HVTFSRLRFAGACVASATLPSLMPFSRVLRPVIAARLPACVALATLAMLPAAFAATATLRPSKDTTIYGSGDANLSNGAGANLFAGSSGPSGGGRILRSLVAFNLSGQIPAGSTINSVTLTLGTNTPLGGNSATVELHRLTADWGEGTSNPMSGGGGGAQATSNDATWNDRFFGVS